ncbi:MAG: DUF4910 domain-containing protein [Dehalococcoidia bacterium]
MTKTRLLSLALVVLVVTASCRLRDASPTAVATEEIPTGTHSPTLTITPTSIPGETPTLIPSPADTSRVLGDVAFGYVQKLAEEIGPRESATEQEELAAGFLAEELRGFGYEVEVQTFQVRRFSTDTPFITISSPLVQIVVANFINLTGTGEVSAALMAVGLGQAEDFPSEGLGGKIALIERGELSFEEKVHNAQDAMASAAIIYNSEAGNFFGTLATESTIPALSVSQEDGLHLLELLDQGEVILDVRLNRTLVPSRNVVASKVVSGFATVVIGAHYDTIPDVAGANDNASGTAVLLTLARELKDEVLPFTLRFVAFGSEEIGLIGSQNYVASLRLGGIGRVRAMLNFDAVGSGGRLEIGGERILTDTTLKAASEMGIQVSLGSEPLGTASDHFVFQAAGVPVIYFAGRDFSRIHTPQDTLEFVERDLLGDAVSLGLALIEALVEE